MKGAMNRMFCVSDDRQSPMLLASTVPRVDPVRYGTWNERERERER